MRLLLASYYYPPSIGGIERQSWLLAHGLAERGHSVRVVCARVEGAPTQEHAPGVAVQRVSPGRGGRWQRMATYIAGLLWAAVRSRDWTDVIHVQQVLYPAAAMAAAVTVLRRPLVVVNHGSGAFGGVQTMLAQPLGRLCLRLTGRIAVGVSLSDEMIQEMRLAGFSGVQKIPNGVPIPAPGTELSRAAARRRLRLSGHVVLYLGRLSREKGVDVLARAWTRLEPRPDANLLFVGNGPLREEVQNLLASSPCGKQAEFRPATSDVGPYLEAADIFVLPSRTEGLSYGLLEAMAQGLPTVATSAGGNREVIDRTEVGLLVAPDDASALAGALGEVLDDPGLAQRLGEAARAHVQQKYSLDAMITAYERLYLQLRPTSPAPA